MAREGVQEVGNLAGRSRMPLTGGRNGGRLPALVPWATDKDAHAPAMVRTNPTANSNEFLDSPDKFTT